MASCKRPKCNTTCLYSTTQNTGYIVEIFSAKVGAVFANNNLLFDIKSSECLRRFDALQLMGLIVDIVIILNSLYKFVTKSEFEFDNKAVHPILLNLLNSPANAVCSANPKSSFV